MGMIFKIMTFNLRYNNFADGNNAWPYRIEKVIKIINDNNPLIIGTQEGLSSMLNELDPSLSNYNRIGAGRMGGVKGEYSAIFYKKTKLEVLNHGQFWLSKTPSEVASISWGSSLPRICTWGHFRFINHPQKEFVCYNTHLDHFSQEAREKGIILIWKKMMKLKTHKKLPLILMGDLNSKPKETVVNFLRGNLVIDGLHSDLVDVYSEMKGRLGTTFHDFSGKIAGEPIDYIFVTPDITILSTKIDTRMILGGYPSDHFPVVTELSL